jgi:hypothetical protein
MIQLSYIIDNITKEDFSDKLKTLQKALWDKYNKDSWLERLNNYLE